MALQVEKSTPQDIGIIRALTEQIWPTTYGPILSQEQISYMLEMMYSEASLQKQFDEGHTFIIVYDEQNPVAFASYSLQEKSIWKLHKIYILPDKQGKGIGKYMIDFITRDISQKGARSLILNVNRHNPAKLFYEKAGFHILREEDIEIGQGFYMNDFIMEKKLL